MFRVLAGERARLERLGDGATRLGAGGRLQDRPEQQVGQEGARAAGAQLPDALPRTGRHHGDE